MQSYWFLILDAFLTMAGLWTDKTGPESTK